MPISEVKDSSAKKKLFTCGAHNSGFGLQAATSFKTVLDVAHYPLKSFLALPFLANVAHFIQFTPHSDLNFLGRAKGELSETLYFYPSLMCNL